MTEDPFLGPEDGEGLSPKVRTLWFLRWLLATLFFTPIVLFFDFRLHRIFDDHAWVGQVPTGLLTVVFLLVLRLPGLLLLPHDFRLWRYQLTPEFLTVSHGVLSRERKIIPLKRLQYVELESGFLDTRLGLVEAKIYMAGGGGMISIPGITRERAEALRQEVLALKGTADESV